ncbi:hypothetical protein N7474_009464 [Penicillium riverlandense]|uniref:uncharacterized protein n=1 Tax=Penicillium riverlandense TaxID=1903569 RepID=UPI0025494B9C|nr:uncharacterized protein N7474_009464 [Penicillium riverlandense]KAJ5808195.1 hypothetical protein N7474_009464 [Penicillium riverlandense]
MQITHRSTCVIVPYFLKKGKGKFITIGSTGGIRPRPCLVWYNASKAAAMLATKNMAVEYASRGIRFNSVCPGFGGHTRLSSHFMGKKNTDENRAQFEAVVPMGCGAEASDVVSACLFLASDEACFMSEDLGDGGRCV